MRAFASENNWFCNITLYTAMAPCAKQAGIINRNHCRRAAGYHNISLDGNNGKQGKCASTETYKKQTTLTKCKRSRDHVYH